MRLAGGLMLNHRIEMAALSVHEHAQINSVLFDLPKRQDI
jgi:hypothetical protein